MEPERKIPRITHQIWFQGWDKLPAKFQVNADALAQLNPDYTHMKWDEKSLRAECLKVGPEVAAKFDSFPIMMQKIDLGRYAAVYNYGGVSVDTDMVQLKPINVTPGINTASLMVSTPGFPMNLMGYTTNSALIITQPQHKILYELIQTIVANTTTQADYKFKEQYIADTTGPNMVASVFTKYRGDIVFLDNKYFEPCWSFNPMCIVGPTAIMDHKHEGSWVSSTMKIFAVIFSIFLYILLIGIAVGVLYGGYWMFTSRRFVKMSRKVRG
jgi:mannosyltransferase OCH1-like enzyme